ncbi:hypothetical protein BH23VER1_BH23VER1_09770 [soil metagenome]
MKNRFARFHAGGVCALALAVSAQICPVAQGQEILLSDDFTVEMNSQAGALDDNIFIRQSGSLAVIDYLTGPGDNPNIQLGNTGTLRTGSDGNYLLMAGGARGSLNRNFNGQLSQGGLEITFDVAADLAAGTIDWTALNIGMADADRLTFVNGAETHFGFLFRANGMTQAFDGAQLLPGSEVAWSPMIEGGVDNFDPVRFVFTDPADGNPFDGTGSTKIEVFSSLVENGETPIFTFTKPGGGYAENFINVHSIAIGGIDNLVISSLGERVEIDRGLVLTSAAPSDPIGTLRAVSDSGPEPSTFELVAGTGDSDNAKFLISGDVLQAGDNDFSGDGAGTSYRIRVRATGNTTGTVIESALVLLADPDTDNDGLSDAWELRWTDDLTALSDTGNFDLDSLTDAEEYAHSIAAFPNINPTLADSDGDTLEDGEEIAGTATRAPTDPTLADTDGDHYRDDYEFDNDSDPNDPGSIPPLPAPISIIPLTDDASSGVSASTVYTHAISGGGAATINGVFFEELNPFLIPINFFWDAPGNMAEIEPTTLGDWNPSAGNLTGFGLLELFGGFTYSPDGAGPGSTQTFTLTGLTLGQAYDLRLYIRIWDTEGSGRPIELALTNGATQRLISPPGGFPQDRPDFILGLTSGDQAYIMSYPYVAESTEIILGANVPTSAPANSGSFHLYGLSNQVSGVSAPFRILSISRDPDGNATLVFQSSPGQQFDIEVSTTLAAGSFSTLADEISADETGNTTTFIDSILAPVTSGDLFYQVRRR